MISTTMRVAAVSRSWSQAPSRRARWVDTNRRAPLAEPHHTDIRDRNAGGPAPGAVIIQRLALAPANLVAGTLRRGPTAFLVLTLCH
jgi:hypothetical protein